MEIENMDLLIGEVRKSKTPLNRTSFRNFCVEYTVASFTNEEGETDLTTLVKAIRESKEKEVVEGLGTVKL